MKRLIGYAILGVAAGAMGYTVSRMPDMQRNNVAILTALCAFTVLACWFVANAQTLFRGPSDKPDEPVYSDPLVTCDNCGKEFAADPDCWFPNHISAHPPEGMSEEEIEKLIREASENCPCCTGKPHVPFELSKEEIEALDRGETIEAGASPICPECRAQWDAEDEAITPPPNPTDKPKS